MWKDRLMRMADNLISHEYSCVMLAITDATRDKIKTLGNRISKKDLYYHDSFYGREENPHITALYGIHTNKISEILKVIRDFPLDKINFGFRELSLFQNDDYDVLKVAIYSPDLIQLNQFLKDKLEHTNNYPTYNPHATIAYLQPGKGKKYLGKNFLDYKKSISKNLTISLAHLIDKHDYVL